MKEIVLSTALNDHSIDLLASLKGSHLLEKASKIHIVHCFEVQIYTSDLVAPYVFPTKEKFPEIEEASLKILKGLQERLGLSDQQVELKCFFNESPKKAMIDYLSKVNADLCVVATRGKHGIKGLFSSSFAEHLLKYSPCDIHVLRPVK